MAPQLISLLRAVSENRLDLRLSSFDEAQIRWAVANGLGPILFRAIENDPQASSSPFWTLLRGADLAARVLTAEHVDAINEIIDGCQARTGRLTLLKGISICDQHYPEPHLRPMRDIDFLVEDEAVPDVESLLVELGYRAWSGNRLEFYKTHHHTIPFIHPQKGVWVEIHRGLFPAKTPLGRNKVFGHENVQGQLEPSNFQGKRVTRLSNELQIVYIASHWASDLNLVGGVVAFFDVIFLLKNVREQFRWRQILEWVDGSAASAHLYLMLSYIGKNQLFYIPTEILDELLFRQRSLRNMNLRILHGMIDRYLLSGRAFGHILSERNISILWESLLSSGSHSRNLLLLPRNLLLPYRLRKRFLS